ncbi:hypothetical protein ACETAC_04830 [Aceticella autotrophica]|uniref:Uncharacterized protein n=1 Tax=Aceticella autotrophica TaxID=2755338 RepID=A0A975AX93_9THEO|nr:hypothetical protein [Aceticella autotrophica]QSZ28175.1 hypothetical protein ACETAC_04830 [Aceticella autotrophica]
MIIRRCIPLPHAPVGCVFQRKVNPFQPMDREIKNKIRERYLEGSKPDSIYKLIKIY